MIYVHCVEMQTAKRFIIVNIVNMFVFVKKTIVYIMFWTMLCKCRWEVVVEKERHVMMKLGSTPVEVTHSAVHPGTGLSDPDTDHPPPYQGLGRTPVEVDTVTRSAVHPRTGLLDPGTGHHQGIELSDLDLDTGPLLPFQHFCVFVHGNHLRI